MIFEQTLINPNFVGRDGFKWFLGLTTNADQYSEYGTRAQVRILGYHGEEIPDTELPWAHVLVPLTMGSGNGSMNQGTIHPSSLVVGFFADGDDGQQPIIIGSLYVGGKTEVPIKFSDGSKYFKLFQPQTSPLNPSTTAVIKESRTSVTSTGSNASTKQDPKNPGVTTPQASVQKGGNEYPSVTQVETGINRKTIVGRPGHCRDSKDGFSKITNALNEFIKILNTVNQGATGYINPVLNKITSLSSEIKTIGLLVTDWLSNQVKKVRDFIINEIYNKLKKLIDGIRLPPWAEKIKQATVGKLTDGIWCAVGKVLGKIKDYVTNFLFGLVGNIVSIPLCAAASFVGSMIQTITNELTESLDPLFDQVSEILGPIGQVSSFVSQALSYSKQLLTFLVCDNNPCKEEYDYEMNVGYVPKSSLETFQKSINLYGSSGVSNLLNDADKNVTGWLGGFSGGITPELGSVSQQLSDCNVFSYECGPPTVTIFGGGGSGAAGNAVVDSIGSIIGVNIINPGSGYSQPPYVRFDDSCNNGAGAVGVANIGIVTTGVGNTTIGVTGVTMYYTGSGYLGPSTTGDPCKVTPFDETGAPVIGSIDKVEIIRTGIGYSNTDKIYDAACSNDIELYPTVDDVGRIVDIRILNPGTSVNVFPDLQINSENGFGARLLPTLKFKSISGVTTESNKEKVKSVVYCSENHG